MIDAQAAYPPVDRLTTHDRPLVRGKFIFVRGQKLYIRGVTYGTFRPDTSGDQYHTPEVVERDFAQMIARGINAVRTYTVPPRWLLDLAQQHGLYVMVGLAWEQHVAFLDPTVRRSIEDRVRAGVRACAGHPAVLCYAIGNEIPAHIVRWYGRRRVERFLARLYRAVKAEDPESLVTYVNYPTTEYLRLPFVDLVCFNVYLEAQEQLEAYLARLQNIAGDRPLVMGEIGLDSRRKGEEVQARVLEWQTRTAFAAGCAGAFVFAWTDEWYRGGFAVEDWDFGLVTRDRKPKPALEVMRKVFADIPFARDLCWPRMSVVVCSYNGARTIRDCCEGLQRLDYPNYEVIVVDDGSTDATAGIAGEYGFRVISTPNRGLSNARNTGMVAATGEIIAYLDDDASPDPHWLFYLAATFLQTNVAAVGGPNIASPGDGAVAECVANAPGNPTHILLSDHLAEHIPGCNMAIRKVCLQTIGGFDGQFRVAGDDVDVCWRLQQQGWQIGFSPAAMVEHHRRGSLRAYWKQQLGYGKAEALLEKKWPEKYNATGQVGWSGRVYGRGLTRMLRWRRERIYQGVWGSAPFQQGYEPETTLLESLPLIPEWFLVTVALGTLGTLSVFWRPVWPAVPLFILAASASLAQAGLSAAHASFSPGTRGEPRSSSALVRLRILTAILHLLQPLARLSGRVRHGLTLWRAGGLLGFALPRPRASLIWSLRWKTPDSWLHSIEVALRTADVLARRGGEFDRWDLEIRGGMFGTARTRMAIEEHGEGRQLVRFHTWPRCSPFGLVLILLSAILSMLGILGQASAAAWVFGVPAVLLALRTVYECAAATGAVLHVLAASARSVEKARRSRARPDIAGTAGTRGNTEFDTYT